MGVWIALSPIRHTVSGQPRTEERGIFFDNNLIVPFFDLLFSQFKRVLKNDGSMYCHTDWRSYSFLFPILKKHLEIRNCIVWDYQWMKAGNFYRFQHEFIMFASNPGYKRKFSPAERDIWRIRCINYTNNHMKLHQSQKPVDLAEKMIINSTAPGDTVLDCFMGSGTTGVACVRNNRNFIGMELQEKYFEIAKNRIEDEIKKAENHAECEPFWNLSTGETNVGGINFAKESVCQQK